MNTKLLVAIIATFFLVSLVSAQRLTTVQPTVLCDTTTTTNCASVTGGAIASSQSGTWTVAQGGTWTVQPGNTANTTPWLTNAQQSGTWTVQPGNTANTTAWLVSGVPRAVTMTDRSGTITAGGTSQTLAAVNATRQRIIVQNPCNATESLYINFTGAATTNGTSIELAACGSYDSGPGPVSTQSVTVIAATTGHAFMSKEQ